MSWLAIIILLVVFALVFCRRSAASGGALRTLATSAAVIGALFLLASLYGNRRYAGPDYASFHNAGNRFSFSSGSDANLREIRARTQEEHDRLLEIRGQARQPDALHTRIVGGEGFEVYADGMIFHYSQGTRELFRDPGLVFGPIRANDRQVRPIRDHEHELLKKYRLAAAQPDADQDINGGQGFESYPDGMIIHLSDSQRTLFREGDMPQSIDAALPEAPVPSRPPSAPLQMIHRSNGFEAAPLSVFGTGLVAAIVIVLLLLTRPFHSKERGTGLGWAAMGALLLLFAGGALFFVRSSRVEVASAHRVQMQKQADASLNDAWERLHAPTIALDGLSEDSTAESPQPTELPVDPEEPVDNPGPVKPEDETQEQQPDEPSKDVEPGEDEAADRPAEAVPGSPPNSNAQVTQSTDVTESSSGADEPAEEKAVEDEPADAHRLADSLETKTAVRQSAQQETADSPIAQAEIAAIPVASPMDIATPASFASRSNSHGALSIDVQNAFDDLPTWQPDASSSAVSEPKPGWISDPPRRNKGVVQRVVQAGPYQSVDECFAEIGPLLVGQALERMKKLVHDAYDLQSPYIGNATFQPAEVVRRFCKQKYAETQEFSIGEMKQLYVLMQFDDDADRYLLERWTQHNRFHRLLVVSVGFGIVLGLVFLGFGLLKLDTWTRGYYTKRLFIGVPTAIMLLLFLAVALS